MQLHPNQPSPPDKFLFAVFEAQDSLNHLTVPTASSAPARVKSVTSEFEFHTDSCVHEMTTHMQQLRA